MKEFTKKNSIMQKILSMVLAFAMIATSMFVTAPVKDVKAATTITSMTYYSENDGPVLTGSGTKDASYGFVMPKFNNDASVTFGDVAADLLVSVKVGDEWKDIDTVSKYVYNSNWGHWNDGGFTGYWFKVSETTYVRLSSRSNPNIVLDYTLEFTRLASATITAMSYTQGPDLTAGITGGSGFTYPTFNNDSNVKYEQVGDDLAIFVWSDDSNSWVNLENNAASGWIYDNNWGQFWDGPGGYWFTVKNTTRVKLASKTNPNVALEYTINYSRPERTTYTLTPDGSTTITAGETGAIGLALPKIDGTSALPDEIDAFVYEVYVDGRWVPMTDSASGFTYCNDGYKSYSADNQWGYWVDTIYGLWFQPIQTDMQFRVGYPTDGVKGHSVGNNYVEYTFIGNPDAPRPDPGRYDDIALGTPTDSNIDGWNLIWQDEFNGNTLDTSKWSYQIGNGKTESGNTGWGNNELQYYTNSTNNVYVSDGKLHIKEQYETVTDPNEGTFNVTSGRIRTVSNDETKFAFKYGRIDFRAKLPSGDAVWPALWMLPSDPSIYGVWAASGEIDVMEAKGRYPDTVYGTIHYGGTWPANRSAGDKKVFTDGVTYDNDYHIYSVVWEKDLLKWYVDGKCYFAVDNSTWYCDNAKDNPYAPFDQEFYILMNVAAGGMFDNGAVLNEQSLPATMDVDYVRVYQLPGDTEATYTDNSNPSPQPQTCTVTVDGVQKATVNKGDTFTIPTGIVGYYADGKLYAPGSKYTVNSDVDFETISVSINNSAAIRYENPVGIGLSARIKGSVSAIQNVVKSEGTLIASEDKYDKYTELTLDSNYNILNLVNNGWYNGVVGRYSSVMKGIKPKNYDRNFVARAYVTVTYADGTEATVYSKVLKGISVSEMAYKIKQSSAYNTLSSYQKTIIDEVLNY